MSEQNKKYGIGVALLVAVLGIVAIVVSTTSEDVETDELMGSPEEGVVTVDEIGPPPALIVDPEVSLSGALTPDGNFYQFERSENVPDEDDLNASAPRERWTALVFDDEYDSIDEFLNKNTNVTNQLTLVVVWDANQQDWDVYPNEIFRSDYDIDTLDIFDDEFEGTVIFNTSRAYEYIDHTEDRVGDFEAERGWNYGPKPDFDSIEGKAVIFWEGDVTGDARRLTSSGDLNDPVDRDFYDDLEDDEVYWFYVKGNVTDQCSDNEALVCGVDGNTYQNSCKAEAEDVDVDYDGRCKVDRVALIGRLADETPSESEKLVLEFFESTSDNSAENLDIDESEIDLDDNDTDLAIYRIDGARFEFVTAFEASDVDVRSRSIEIELDGNIGPGEYQLRIFDTFDREKVREIELEFEVEEADPVEGPALVLASEDEEARPSDRIDFNSVNSLLFDRASGFNADKEVVKVFKCDDDTCTSRTDITDSSEIEYRRIRSSGAFSFVKTDGLEIGKYEVEIEDAGFVYDDGRTVMGEVYEFEVVADITEVTYSLKSVNATQAVFQPNRLVSEMDENEVLDNFTFFNGPNEFNSSETTVSFDDATKEVTLEVIGRTFEESVDYRAEVSTETNLVEEWEIESTTITFNGPAVSDQAVTFTYDTRRLLSASSLALVPNVSATDLVEVDESEIIAGFRISDSTGSTEFIPRNDCTFSLNSDKEVIVDCQNDLRASVRITWPEVVNTQDNYTLEEGDLRVSAEAG